MKFFSVNQNQIIFANGKIIASFENGEYETSDREIIEILKRGGYESDKENYEIETEDVRVIEKSDEARKDGEEGVYQTKQVKARGKGRLKKG